jgi:hypothetical protein
MPVLPVALLTVAAAQLLDLATFIEMMRRVGPVAEANPLVAILYTVYGLPIVAVTKVALIGLVTSIVVVMARRPADRMMGVVIGAAIVAGLVGGVSNTLAIGIL